MLPVAFTKRHLFLLPNVSYESSQSGDITMCKSNIQAISENKNKRPSPAKLLSQKISRVNAKSPIKKNINFVTSYSPKTVSNSLQYNVDSA